jgi:UDP-glucose 4-epimerase
VSASAQPGVLVTGGAGFIGAALVSALRRDGTPVTVLDRLPWPEATRLSGFSDDRGVVYHQVALDDSAALRPVVGGHKIVYHLAANTENRTDRAGLVADLEGTVAGTVALLVALSEEPDVSIVLTSSQLVYAPGATEQPITELTGVVEPTTRFAAGKIAAEAFLRAHCHERGHRGAICRLANIVGPGMRRGILYDFVQKVRADPTSLRVLGDGRQTRSYLHVDDCVRALRATASTVQGSTTFNVCNTDTLDAASVAGIVAEEAPGSPPAIVYDGGEAGWRGDVPTLEVWPQRLLDLGWRPAMSSAEAVRDSVRGLFAAGADQARSSGPGTGLPASA